MICALNIASPAAPYLAVCHTPVLLMSFSSPTVLALFLLFHSCPLFPFRYLQVFPSLSLTRLSSPGSLLTPVLSSFTYFHLASPTYHLLDCHSHLLPGRLTPLPRPERKRRIAVKLEHSRLRGFRAHSPAQPRSLKNASWRSLHGHPLPFSPNPTKPPPLLASP